MAVPHPAPPQKVVLDKDLLLSDANNDVICEDHHTAPVRMLLTEAPTIAPVCPHDVHNNTRRMCVGTNRGNRGRSCEEHPDGCGAVVLTDDVIICIRKEQICHS